MDWLVRLEVDDRERQIFPFLPQYFQDGESQIRRLARGDYAVIAQRGEEERLCAVIERKTLKDLAGSLKDGRLENLDGMVEVRRECGCDLWLMIEGPAFPAAESRFGRIPFKTLEVLICDTAVRDGIFSAKVKDLGDSVRWLRMLCNRYSRKLELDEIAGGAEHARGLTLTRRVRKLPNDAERVAVMWGALPGVSQATGLILVGGGSVADWLARGAERQAQLRELRYPGGARLSTRAIASAASLLAGDAHICCQFYGAAPGITAPIARALIEAGFTPEVLLANGPAAAGEIIPPGRKTKLGSKRVSVLIDLMRYQCAPPAGAPEAVAEAAPDQELNND